MPFTPTRRMRKGVELEYTVDEWDERENLVREIARGPSLDEAEKAFAAAIEENPDRHLTLRKGALVMRNHEPQEKGRAP